MRFNAIRLFPSVAVVSAMLSVCVSEGHAGSFGGPAPFRNGSPLTSGTDGVYQCVASAKNVTGLISWQINNGVQTAATASNDWVMYIDGNVLSGQTEANVSQGKVAGVLDSSVGGALPTQDDGTLSLPLAYIVPGNAGAGRFTGKIDLNSPVAAINGSGEISGTPSRTDQIVFIFDPASLTVGTLFDPVTVTPIIIPGSTLGVVEFKIRGTRLSTSTLAQSTGTTSP